MQNENFTMTQCNIFLRDEERQGVVTNEQSPAFICTPNNADPTEQTHISSSNALMTYIANEYERNPRLEIFAITKNETFEITINEQGLLIPKF